MSQTPTSPNASAQGSTRLLITAIVVAVIAVILVNVYIGIVRNQAKAETFTVYRFNHPMERGDEVEQDDLDPFQVPGKLEESFADAVEKSDLTGDAERVGDVLQQPARQNQLFTLSLFRRDLSETLAEKIESNMRLTALPVNSEILPAISPGSSVDILAPFAGPGGGSQTLTVMENVQVLAVGEQTVTQNAEDSRPSRNYDTISIQMTLPQAIAMSAIQKRATGDFELLVRSPGDEGTPMIPAGGINPEVLKRVDVPMSALQSQASGP